MKPFLLLVLAIPTAGCRQDPPEPERDVLELRYLDLLHTSTPTSCARVENLWEEHAAWDSLIAESEFADSHQEVAGSTVVADPVFLDSLSAAMAEVSRQGAFEDTLFMNARLIGFYRHGGRNNTLCAGKYRGVVVNRVPVPDDSLLHALLWSRVEHDW